MRHRLLALVLCTGCVSATFTFTPLAREVNPIEGPCSIEVVTSVPPEKNFQELGSLEYTSGPEPKTLDAFKKDVEKIVCGAGGNAAIAVANANGEYTQGTALKYLPGKAMPLKPVEPLNSNSNSTKPATKPVKELPTQSRDDEKPPGT